MNNKLRILIAEDSEDDALLEILELKKAGFESKYERVETFEAMEKAILEKSWDVILCDYQLPQFNGLAAIDLLQETGIDIPLIIVSGAIGEETAVECMRFGACDYIMKNNMSRLPLAVKRELKETESRLKRKRAEETLRESEERYRTILQNIEEGYYEVDTAGNLTFFNDSVCQILGNTRAELMCVNDRQHADKENSQILYQVFKKVFITGEPSKRVDYELIREDGTKRNIEVSVSLIRNTSGKPIGFRGIMRNVTEQKLAENKLLQTLESLRKSFSTLIQVMVSVVKTRDTYTAGHQARSANIARAIANELGLPKDQVEGIHMAGSIHDIGKLSIPSEILSKPAKLSEIEFSLIKGHSWSGYEILKYVESPWPLAEIVYQHHERMDGSGYPRGLKGDEILIGARIMAVADVVESMASHRPYRPALGINAALEEIENNKETLYDTDVADACLRLFREKDFKLEGECLN
ncbi:HD domain-containing phosphohydrolase [Desulfobacterium sp. N47]